MAKILEKLYSAMTLGAVLVLALLFVYHSDFVTTGAYWAPFFTFLHVLSGICWIGLLYYFNLVQIPTMPKVPAELKPGVSKYIAPEALFWFRWSALSTVVTGLIVATLNGYVHEALTLQPGMTRTIGTGMWLGLIMAFNVWFIIWPNQKKALGLVEADADSKAKAARVAMLASRANFVLSLPMLYCMVLARLVG
ncbi:MAG TPA: urate hydroxylase PuuD [Alphaproteobacteria bacterium]|nr:urate hydroxylase PuuD [Alphaproteobacteria bacterium]